VLLPPTRATLVTQQAVLTATIRLTPQRTPELAPGTFVLRPKQRQEMHNMSLAVVATQLQASQGPNVRAALLGKSSLKHATVPRICVTQPQCKQL